MRDQSASQNQSLDLASFLEQFKEMKDQVAEMSQKIQQLDQNKRVYSPTPPQPTPTFQDQQQYPIAKYQSQGQMYPQYPYQAQQPYPTVSYHQPIMAQGAMPSGSLPIAR